MHRLRSLLNPIVDGIARVFVKLGFSPSGLTVIGVLVACVAAALIARGMLAAGGVVVLVAGIFDLFDGAVARMTIARTKFGALFDSVMDRCRRRSCCSACCGSTSRTANSWGPS